MKVESIANMAEATTIGVVIFSYNYGRFLRDAIDSVLAQSRPFDQILVVDDGSTDDSRDIIRSYGSRIESLFKANSGQTGAAIAALSRINTRYVYFLDADDYVDPDAVETISEHLAGSPLKIQFQLRCVDNNQFLDSVIPAYPKGYNSADMIRDNGVIGFYISPPTSGNVFSVKMLRTLPLEVLSPRDPFDGVPMMCLPYLGEVRSVPRIIANYRIHGANYSMQHAPTVEMFERDLQLHHRRWREIGVMAPGATLPPPGSTVIELEARCLMKPLGGERVPVSLASQYIKQLHKSSMSLPLKSMLSMFMLALVALPDKLGSRLIQARRSPIKRHFLLKKFLRVLLGIHTKNRT